jgi:hypothetical protein
MPLESDYAAALLLAAPRALPDLRLFKRQVMLVQVPGAGRGPARSVRVGVPGQADLYGITRASLHVELELKTLSGVLSPDQRAWGAWCAAWGVPYTCLRPLRGESLEGTVARWCTEIATLLDPDPLAALRGNQTSP